MRGTEDEGWLMKCVVEEGDEGGNERREGFR